MAKSKTGATGVGDNSGLTPDEQAALFLTHLGACREQEAILADAMAGVKALRKRRNEVRNLARAEGFPLKKIDDILKKESFSQKDLEAEAELFRWMDQIAGLPVGGQADLFASTPVEIKDGMDWEADGYRAGMRATEPKPPSECPERFHQDWMKGYHNGQERNAWALAERGKIVDRRTDIAPGKVELEPVEDDRDEDEVIDDAARKLKREGWTQPSAEEAGVGAGETQPASELEPA